MDHIRPNGSFGDVLFILKLMYTYYSTSERTSRLKSIEIVDWAKYGAITSFINVLLVFNLIYTCYFTKSTPNLTKPIKKWSIGPKVAQQGPNASFFVILSKLDQIYTCISVDQLRSILKLTNWFIGSNIDQ